MNGNSSIMITRTLFAFLVGAIQLCAQDKPTATQEPANAGVSIWTQNVSGFRKEHGSHGGYTKRWDLSDLPHYVPKQQVSGTLRFWGNNYLKDGVLGDYWQEDFKKFQPNLTIEYHLPTEAVALPALACGVADVGMDNKATLSNQLIFEQLFHYGVTQIRVATGSYDVYGWTPAGIVVVHPDNPLDQISVKQIDGVFGAARTGGYVGTVWHTEYPYSRGADENIRTWDQLGLTGEWAGQPIHPGGQNLYSGKMIGFSNKILRGSGQFVEGYQAYTNYVMPDGKVNSWSDQVRRAAARDRYSIFYVSPLSLGPELKELAVQAYNGGPFVRRTLETVHDRTYPLTGEQLFFVNRAPGKPLPPKVDEFIHFILSQEGQDCIQREGRYLPLTAEVVREQLKKLE
ncbi:MAG: hypothetical protein PHQ04_01610 [Opitutaceae bacterium]|nr:hypothetical protein [Opitutaceae bacterium]